MIDWLTLKAHVPHAPITGGMMLLLDDQGNEERRHQRFAQVEEPSHSCKIALRTDEYTPDGWGAVLWVSGNPAKLLQGHGLWGSDDVEGMAKAFVERALELMGEPQELGLLFGMTCQLQRIDVTYNMKTGSRERARAWIRAAAPVIRGRRQGVSSYMGKTLYVGQGSRRKTFKIYVKGDEQEVKGHGTKGTGYTDEQVALFSRYADDLLRFELTLKSMELKDKGLDRLTAWYASTPQQVWQEAVGMLNLPAQLELKENVVLDLKPRQVGVYEVWRSGRDPKQVYARRTFYRLRSELLVHGIDIDIPPRDLEVDNVVPLVNFITAEPAGVPDWATSGLHAVSPFGVALFWRPKLRAL